jgi:hypothetical protein
MSEFQLTTETEEPGLDTAMKVVYQWNYEPDVEELRSLYHKATEAQWVAERDIDWDRPIDRDLFATTPLGSPLPIERTSYWKGLDDELRWNITRRTAGFRLSNRSHRNRSHLASGQQAVRWSSNRRPSRLLQRNSSYLRRPRQWSSNRPRRRLRRNHNRRRHSNRRTGEGGRGRVR